MVARPGPWGEAREGTAGTGWLGWAMHGEFSVGQGSAGSEWWAWCGLATFGIAWQARQGKVIGGTVGQSRMGGGVFGIARGGNVRRGDAGLAVWLKRVSALAS
jgi:hypothetical protein